LLWDLDSFTIKRALNGAHDIGIQQAIFSPSGEFIITCFKNDEIVGWDVHALQVTPARATVQSPLCLRALG